MYKKKILNIEINANYKDVNKEFNKFLDPDYHVNAWNKYEMKVLNTKPLLLDL